MSRHIRICSDLHLEGFYGRNEETLAIDFLPRDDRDDTSVLVLAGDISSVPDQLVRFLDACLYRFSDVIFVPGNHEFYRHNIDAWEREMEDRLGELASKHLCHGAGLYYSTGDVLEATIGGLRFIFGTMWGDGGPTLADQAKTGFYLNDFRLIKTGEEQRLFTVTDMKERFKDARFDIEECLKANDMKKVVVTHHLPSRRLVSKRFWPGDGSDGANGGFVGDCDSILAKTEIAPALWIHGHTHDTIDTKLWDTRVVCNPAGYRGEWVSPYNTFMQMEGPVRVTVPKFIDVKEL